MADYDRLFTKEDMHEEEKLVADVGLGACGAGAECSDSARAEINGSAVADFYSPEDEDMYEEDDLVADVGSACAKVDSSAAADFYSPEDEDMYEEDDFVDAGSDDSELWQALKKRDELFKRAHAIERYMEHLKLRLRKEAVYHPYPNASGVLRLRLHIHVQTLFFNRLVDDIHKVLEFLNARDHRRNG